MMCPRDEAGMDEGVAEARAVKPDVAAVLAHCPGVDAGFAADHIARLDRSYFETFSPDQVASHVAALSALSADEPAQVLMEAHPDGTASCTFLAFDSPSAFSLITGVLASVGFSILSGAAFTYGPAPAPASHRRQPALARRWQPLGIKRKRIIDVFRGRPPSRHPAGDWAGLARARTVEVLGLLDEGDSGLDEAKRRVNEWVVQRIDVPEGGLPRPLEAPDVRLDRRGESVWLGVTSIDTPAFLYSLSAALSFHAVSIERVRIETRGTIIEDELELRLGGPDGAAALERIRLSVLMTKQFTYFLSGAADPFVALARFETLMQHIFQGNEQAEWLAVFSDRSAMGRLARILGASDFLWEDFIQIHSDLLLPVLARPRPAGHPATPPPRKVPFTPPNAASYEERRDAVNEYKDRASFEIELADLLDEGQHPARLSERLTELGEELIRVSVAAVFGHLGGLPVQSDAEVAGGTLFGLGKFGGASLGYASDLEVLLVVRSAEQAELFTRLMHELPLFSRSKQDGLFQIDPRLRPFGRDGPLAVTLDSFTAYYGPGGPAHSLERLALTRLRAIAGDVTLGGEVESLRDRLVYERRWLNMDELQEARARQLHQKQAAQSHARPNVKYSPGGLVDVEYTIQILQVVHGGRDSRVRTPLIREAPKRLRDGSVITDAEASILIAAYDFLSRLVNGLRMVRGRASDLLLPAVDSPDCLHLARRMGYHQAGGAGDLHRAYQIHTAAVRAIAGRYHGPPRL
ncbi:MAG: [protein-PII] uridylyltransferase family protein [Chloroflexota bacterium]